MTKQPAGGLCAASLPLSRLDPKWRPSGPFALIGRFYRLMICWNQRAMERRHLLNLNEHMLKDIGLTGADIVQECEKPFWQA